MATLNTMLNNALMQNDTQAFLEQAIPILAYDVVNGKSNETDLDALMRNALLESENNENEDMIKAFLNRFGEIASSMYDNDKVESDFLQYQFNPYLTVQDAPKIDKDSRLYRAWLNRDTSVGKMSDFKVKLQAYIDSKAA